VQQLEYRNNTVLSYIYLRAEVNSKLPITASARVQTATAKRHHGKKQTKTRKKRSVNVVYIEA
jgi:hypothetical protein